MMGGQEASKISSAIKINSLSSESDYNSPASEVSDEELNQRVQPMINVNALNEEEKKSSPK